MNITQYLEKHILAHPVKICRSENGNIYATHPAFERPGVVSGLFKLEEYQDYTVEFGNEDITEPDGEVVSHHTCTFKIFQFGEIKFYF